MPTPNLGLPFLMAAQAQKHVTHNEALRALDALVHLAAIDRDASTPPASPEDGDRYIVAVGGAGAWEGHDLEIAAYQDGAWAFFAPLVGWRSWISDEEALVVWDGSAWSLVGGGGGGSGGDGDFDTVGINATADTTNRLAVAAAASLFNHAGHGHQQKINKAAAGDTASQLYQTGFSGRAEIGLTGDDDFHFKVSADGSAWNESILIDKDTGEVSFPSGVDIDNPGLPAGGTTGQVLAKASNDDGDVAWATPAGGGDMLASMYDPESVAGDAFDMANMAEAADAKVMTAAERTKLAGIASGATANSADATLLARANHTGTQALATIADAGLLAALSSVNNSHWSGADLDVANGGTGASDASGARTNLGLVIGTNVQPHSARLAEIAALAVTDSNVIVGNGSAWVAESGATARTSLGLGTGDTPQFTALDIGHASDTTLSRASAGNLQVEGNVLYRAGGTDVPIADGGTGASDAATAFANLKQAATTSATGVVEKATDAEVRTATADKYLSADLIESASAAVALTDAATIALDWEAGFFRTLTITANRALGNPTNGHPGTVRTVYVIGNDGTDRTLTFGTQYGGEPPTLTDIDSTKAYVLTILCVTTTHFVVTAVDGSPP